MSTFHWQAPSATAGGGGAGTHYHSHAIAQERGAASGRELRPSFQGNALRGVLEVLPTKVFVEVKWFENAFTWGLMGFYG